MHNRSCSKRVISQLSKQEILNRYKCLQTSLSESGREKVGYIFLSCVIIPSLKSLDSMVWLILLWKIGGHRESDVSCCRLFQVLCCLILLLKVTKDRGGKSCQVACHRYGFAGIWMFKMDEKNLLCESFCSVATIYMCSKFKTNREKV